MRLTRPIPKTDIDRFKKEILSRGPSAALPRNLPDRWLRALGRDVVRSLRAEAEDRDVDNSAVLGPMLAAIASLANDELPSDPEFKISDEQVRQAYAKYCAATLDEIIRRQTGVYLELFSESALLKAPKDNHQL